MRVDKEVLDFLNKYPGLVFVLQKVEARGPSPELGMISVRGAGRPRVTSDTQDCVQAALVNGLDALWDSEEDRAAAVSVSAAVLAPKGQRCLVFRSLEPVGAVMNKMQRGLSGCVRVTVQGRNIGA